MCLHSVHASMQQRRQFYRSLKNPSYTRRCMTFFRILLFHTCFLFALRYPAGLNITWMLYTMTEYFIVVFACAFCFVLLSWTNLSSTEEYLARIGKLAYSLGEPLMRFSQNKKLWTHFQSEYENPQVRTVSSRRENESSKQWVGAINNEIYEKCCTIWKICIDV